MKNFVVATLLCQLASAQLIDLDFINAQPDPTYSVATDKLSEDIPYDQAATIAQDGAEFDGDDLPLDVVANEKRRVPMRFEKRQSGCSPMPTTPNTYNADLSTAKSFREDQNLAAQALGDGASAPAGYMRLFTNKNAAAEAAQGYMGFTSMKTYDVPACAEQCNKRKLCQSFNLYFARDPTISPGADCVNPPATANIRCVMYGGTIEEGNATNRGQWRRKFETAYAGSNGYVKTSSLGEYSDRAINAPEKDCTGENPSLGMRLFNDGKPFDPERCAAVCADFNTVAAQEGSDRLCRFYNTYILSKNSRTQGVVCQLYTREFDQEEFATNRGQTDEKGARFTISSSVFSAYSASGPAPACLPTCETKVLKGSLTSANQTLAPDYNLPIDTPFEVCIMGVCTSKITVFPSGFFRGKSSGGLDIEGNVLRNTWQIAKDEAHYISVETCVAAGARTWKIEWRVERTNPVRKGTNRFSATFYEDKPGVVRYSYPELGGVDRGSVLVYGVKDPGAPGRPDYRMIHPPILPGRQIGAGDEIIFDSRANVTTYINATSPAPVSGRSVTLF